MSYSKHKPYKLIGVQNQRQRGFGLWQYGTKLGLRQYLSYSSRYMKEMAKESRFEKPYLQTSRPQMHADWSTPSWHIPIPTPPGLPRTDQNYIRIVFAPGMLSIFAFSPIECGETGHGSAMIMLPPAMNKNTRVGWIIYSDSEEARIDDMETWPPNSNIFASFKIETDELDEDKEVNICAKASTTGEITRVALGKAQEYPFKIDPPPRARLSHDWYGTPMRPPTSSIMPIDVRKYTYPMECTTVTLVKCGCVEPYVAWDWSSSDQTIEQSDTAAIYVKDGDGPYDWVISSGGANGFTLSSPQTAGVGNTLIADAAACGGAAITVTDKCGNSCSGSVRNTDDGQWADQGLICGLTGQATEYGSLSSVQYKPIAIYGEEKQMVSCNWDNTSSDNDCEDYDGESIYSVMLRLLGCPGSAPELCITWTPPCTSMHSNYKFPCEETDDCAGGNDMGLGGGCDPLHLIGVLRANFTCKLGRYYKWECT